MIDVSVIIPARNEQFLTKTIRDIVSKIELDTEVIAVLEGYWPDEIVDDPHVHYIHFARSRGMRAALNAGVAIARGKFVMKLDGHCMVGPGFDKVLAETCQDNWVCVPTRHRLDAEAWTIKKGRPPINYLFINDMNDSLDGKLWNQKNRDRSLDAERVVDLIGCQGSCYFLPRALWYELELLDEEHYGTFRKDPQEVMFKCWTYGGRCVRVKDTWYAHLHKGRQYGRGYRLNRSDYRKGDEFVKQWWTDSAWDKQQISLRTIFADHFSDMPGWTDHPWMKDAPSTREESTPTPRPAARRRYRTYQYLEVDGQPFTKTPSDRTGSRFWNEGKWENFIAPLLPEDCTDRTFVEMGCDAGLFLKLAKDRGFRTVVGVEKNKTPHAAALQYRDAIGYDYKVLKRALGGKFGYNGNFNIDELPIADVTLMANFHYHIAIEAWYKYLDRLIAKSCYVLIVSITDLARYHWRVNSTMGYVRNYFHNWEQVGMVDANAVPQEGDPKPRNMFSVLFKSPYLRRVPIDAITTRTGSDFGHLAIQHLTERALRGEEIDITDTDLWADWRKRKRRWTDRTLRWFVQGKLDLVKSLIEDGPCDPVLVQRDTLKMADGGHRLVILKALGYDSVIVREI
jgi:glycosyltransferase involved in cell wall biosynthesis